MSDVKRITVFDRPWWYVARIYDDPVEAKQQFDLVNEHAARLKGEAKIAGYRLLEGEARLVVVLGHIEERVKEAAELLGGEPHEMHPRSIVALVARRLRFLMAAHELRAGPGVHTFQHGEGLRLDERGRVVPNE